MKYNVISSSSSGNCIIVEDILVLDIGVPYKKVQSCLKNVKIIFISHVHSDHLQPTTIKKIAYSYPNIKFIASSIEVVKMLVNLGVLKKNIFYLKPKKWYSVGIMKIKTEPLTHDVENYGLKWEFKEKKGFYATDTCNLDGIEAKNYDLYLIEANYSEELLQKHKEECQDEKAMVYLNRVPYTHLSLEQTNSFLIENMGNDSEYAYVHKSSYNFEEE